MSTQVKEQNNVKLVKATARQLRIAPRKLRLAANLVKGMNAADAIVQLQYVNKKAAPMVIRLIRSAIANAKNNFSLDADHLYIKSITADMGQALKRYFPRARGSAFVIRRKLSHLNLVLEERKSGKAAKSKVSFLKKAEEKKTGPEDVEKVAAAAKKAPKEMGRKSEVGKTEQQMKLNQAQNKRRLFNRKSGE